MSLQSPIQPGQPADPENLHPSDAEAASGGAAISLCLVFFRQHFETPISLSRRQGGAERLSECRLPRGTFCVELAHKIGNGRSCWPMLNCRVL